MPKIKIVLEHPDFVVVNKPAGLPVHAHSEPTLVDLMREQLCSDQVHPVHRLDLATSGLLILAKNSEANRLFCQAFADRQIHKMYIALSTGKPKQKQGWIKGDMEKARGGSFKLAKTFANPAMTYAQSFGQQGSQGGQSPRLWVMRPLTGKTHQLRVALKSFGAAILGDDRYGGAAADRLYLHAWALKFHYCGVLFSVMAPPTTGQHFLNLHAESRLDALGDPWCLPWPAAIASLVDD